MSKPKTFKELKKKWYDKLKKDGFTDIENSRHELIQFHSTLISKPSHGYTPETFKIKQDYYYYATQFLGNYKFESRRDEIIWEYHTNGISCRNISKLLKRVRIRMSKSVIHRTIKRLKQTMYATYLPNQKLPVNQ